MNSVLVQYCWDWLGKMVVLHFVDVFVCVFLGLVFTMLSNWHEKEDDIETDWNMAMSHPKEISWDKHTIIKGSFAHKALIRIDFLAYRSGTQIHIYPFRFVQQFYQQIFWLSMPFLCSVFRQRLNHWLGDTKCA